MSKAADGEPSAKLISIQGVFFLSGDKMSCPNLTLSSHEGLMLAYEEALTRDFPVPDSVSSPLSLGAADPRLSSRRAHYNIGAHFLWIGDRTRQITGAHVEYFRGIRNPIGIKVGQSMAVDEIVRLLDSECSVASIVLVRFI
jgi:3-deoxy-D-arabino-heptulosonate 7-phosphate (DAHP) synthase class II